MIRQDVGQRLLDLDLRVCGKFGEMNTKDSAKAI
jgi:hypothetical protein